MEGPLSLRIENIFLFKSVESSSGGLTATTVVSWVVTISCEYASRVLDTRRNMENMIFFMAKTC
ncbi:hypothetical protein BRDCF_p283 [Bacteroidales bacterium CF]|nr:hypothetical protein BRDCF_p283 [Bacteroidales bacterium CF]